MTTEPMRPDDPMRLSGAIWCEKHGMWECSRRRKDGEPCHEAAIKGTDVGRMHAGRKSEVVKADGAANMAAWSLAVAAGLEEQIDLSQLMLTLIVVTRARLEVYAGDLRDAYERDGVGALVGSTWAAGRNGESVQTGEQIRGLAKLEGAERDKLASYVERAHRMGIATQVIELAQGQAEIVVLAFRAALEVAGAELLPGVRAVMVETFLGRLGAGDVVQIEAGGQS